MPFWHVVFDTKKNWKVEIAQLLATQSKQLHYSNSLSKKKKKKKQYNPVVDRSCDSIMWHI